MTTTNRDIAKKIMVFSFVICLAMPLYAKTSTTENDTLEIDLLAAVKTALGSSPEVVRNKADLEISKLALRASGLELYAPQVDLEFDVPSYQQAFTENYIYNPDIGMSVRRWVESENRRWIGDISARQPLPTGGTIYLQSMVYKRFYADDIDLLDNDKEEYSSSWRLSFRQELLRGNLVKIARDKAKLSYNSTLISLARSNQQMIFNVVNSYYSIIASQRELLITKEDLQVSFEAAVLARRKFEAGLIPEVEALQLEVEVAQKEAELSSAESYMDSQLDNFRSTLGLKLDRPIRVSGEPLFDTLSVDLDESVEQALDNRESIRLSHISVKQAEFALSDSKRPWRPSGYLDAYYNLEKREDALNDVFSSQYNDYNVNRGVTFTLSMPIISGGRKKTQVQQSIIALRRSRFEAEETKKDVILEVRDAVRKLREAKHRYEITLRSLEIALSSYEITQNRFENGQVTARVWIEAQLSLKRNRISALRALIDHNLAVARYRLSVGEPILPVLGDYHVSQEG